MTTIKAGFRNLRRAPLALIPLAVEAVVGAVLLVLGAFPKGAASASATAAFPMDVFFDVKQSVAWATTWVWFLLALGGSIVVRSVFVGATLYLSDGNEAEAPPYRYFLGVVKAAAPAAVLFIVPATLYYAGVAVRYAPFIFVAGATGVAIMAFFVQRVVPVCMPGSTPALGATPKPLEAFFYGYVVCVIGFGLSVLCNISLLLAAILLVLVAPIHALYLVGWRESVRKAQPASSGILAGIVTAVVVIVLGGFAVMDRVAKSPPPRHPHPTSTLLLLGGADSTFRSGALTTIHLTDLGFNRKHTRVLSYEGIGKKYGKADTHKNLDVVARRVSAQIGQVSKPVLLGHSQAALILDRLLAKGGKAPRRAVELAPPPPRPSVLEAPRPSKDGAGVVGADLSRLFSELLRRAGAGGFDIDAPTSPVRLDKVVVPTHKVPRLAIFSIDDASWLEGDWRRPGEHNLISLSDHTGITGDGYALAATRRFLHDKKVPDDGTMWKSVFLNVISYAFAPWRPQ